MLQGLMQKAELESVTAYLALQHTWYSMQVNMPIQGGPYLLKYDNGIVVSQYVQMHYKLYQISKCMWVTIILMKYYTKISNFL